MPGTNTETGEPEFLCSHITPTTSETNLHKPGDHGNQHYDIETGEPADRMNCTIKSRKSKFMIPKNLLKQDPPSKCCIDTNQTFTLSKKKEVITLQEVFVLKFIYLTISLYNFFSFFSYRT